MRTFHYVASCVEANGDDINEMRHHPRCRAISYDTMRKNCVGFIDWAVSKGYRAKELMLKNDWHVAYYSSYYRGNRCYFLVWSGIEFIWTRRVYGPKDIEARPRSLEGARAEIVQPQELWDRLSLRHMSRTKGA